MATLKRISPGSAFKIGMVMYALIGMVVGAVMGLFGMIAGQFITERNPIPGASLGLVAIIVFPILYGIIGGCVSALSAIIYNLAAGWMGGLEVDIS
jgi:hypothetical protein